MGHRNLPPLRHLLAGFVAVLLVFGAGASRAGPDEWKRAWPKTDFSRHTADLSLIREGGPPKDGIPAIDTPRFAPAGSLAGTIAPGAPVITLVHGGQARAYPLSILLWHEIVNDRVGGTPVAVTYCPLCNAALVFDRRQGEDVLSFGTTGKLLHSDLVMYDRQSESWWQQFTGEAIAGARAGERLRLLPSRIESFDRFLRAFPQGEVLRPPAPQARPYGFTPYAGYDVPAGRPPLYDGSLPEGIAPMARVVAVEGAGGPEAFALSVLRARKRITRGEIEISWEPGQHSVLDAREIAKGRDVGNVRVRRKGQDVPHTIPFAFVFHAFHPGQPIHTAHPPDS